MSSQRGNKSTTLDINFKINSSSVGDLGVKSDEQIYDEEKTEKRQNSSQKNILINASYTDQKQGFSI